MQKSADRAAVLFLLQHAAHAIGDHDLGKYRPASALPEYDPDLMVGHGTPCNGTKIGSVEEKHICRQAAQQTTTGEVRNGKPQTSVARKSNREIAWHEAKERCQQTVRDLGGT